MIRLLRNVTCLCVTSCLLAWLFHHSLRIPNSRCCILCSIMRQSTPLRDSIRHELSTRDPSADDWLWLQQHPQAVASFVSVLEKDKRFTAVTSTYALLLVLESLCWTKSCCRSMTCFPMISNIFSPCPLNLLLSVLCCLKFKKELQYVFFCCFVI